MAYRLALAGCRGPHEGPWTLAKGNEIGLEVFGLGEGSLVVFEGETIGDTVRIEHSCNGQYPLPKIKFKRYRVNKIGIGSETTVRVMLDGVA